MRKMLLVWLLLSLLSLCLAGCYNRLELDDSVGVTGFGLDVEGEQKVFLVQVTSPSGKPEGGQTAKVDTLVLKEKAAGYAQAARQITLSFPRTPVWSLATTILLGEQLAREDLALVMDFVSRNRFIRPNMLLFLTAGTTPEEVMQLKTPPENHSLVALEKIIRGQQNYAEIYLPVTLREFRTKYATPGVEPVLPQVRIEENAGEKTLRIHGVAVFRERRLVGELDEIESRGLRFLDAGEMRGGLVTVNLSGNRQSGPLEEMVSMEIIHSRARCTPLINEDGSIEMLIDIEADGNLYEQTTTENLQTTENLPRLEQLTAAAIKEDAMACIKKAQLLGSDIFGWGEIISRKHPAVWRQLEADWPAHFSNLKVRAEARYSIRRAYLLDGPVPIKN
ncbi:MAG: Ger(x)C family spore germination protein [Syntrophomonadaceae bacterium]|nr:Ger(x)C family spore germination protein [Syntrophomonadaceae bacterium]